MGLQNKCFKFVMNNTKKFTDKLDFSSVKLGWNLLRRFRNPSGLSSPSIQMKNISSIYLNDNHGLKIFESRKSFSILCMNKNAYGRSGCGKLSFNGCSRNLLNDFSLKFKETVFQYKFSHFN